MTGEMPIRLAVPHVDYARQADGEPLRTVLIAWRADGTTAGSASEIPYNPAGRWVVIDPTGGMIVMADEHAAQQILQSFAEG